MKLTTRGWGVLLGLIIAAVLLIGAVPPGWWMRSAHGTTGGGTFRYPATVKCEVPMSRKDAVHVALVGYHWTQWGELRLRYVCGTAIAKGANR